MARQRGGNPYIAGRALRGGRGFFGRDDVLHAVREELSTPDGGSIVLFGQRRIGKTSILLRLVDDLEAEGFLPIYLDLMDLAARPLSEVLHALATKAALALDQPTPAASDFDDDGSHFLEVTLPWLYDAAGAHRPVFVLDEFDDLDRAHEDRLSSNAAARSFFPYLRRLMETEPRLGFVFAIGRKAGDLSIDVKALFKATRSKRVTVLRREAADELIRSAERNGTLRFDDAAVDRIVALTAGHPYMTQLYCQRLWHHLHRAPADAPGPPAADVAAVDAVLDDVLEAGENVFHWIWEGLPAAERVILSVLADATDGSESLDRDALEVVLQESGVRLLSHELEVAPDKLADWDLLRETDGRYSVLVELLRLWVARHKPIGTVRDELDRIVPLADAAYQTGEIYFSQQNLESAKDLLQQALRSNPNHIKARRRLVDIHIERGDLDEALTELEHIGRLDPPAARIPTVHVLSLQAEENERADDEDAALGLYERILEISPHEPAALERRAQILTARGDVIAEQIESAALNSEYDVEVLVGEARALYEQAANRDRLEQLAERERHSLRRARLARAAAHEDAEEWAEAASLYALLTQQAPEDDDLRRRASRVAEQQELSQLYTEAQALLDREQLDDAIRAYADLVHRAPTYRDAAQQLAGAVQDKQRTQQVAKKPARTKTRSAVESNSPSSTSEARNREAPNPRLQPLPDTRKVVKLSRPGTALFWGIFLVIVEAVLFGMLWPHRSASNVRTSLKLADAELVTPEKHSVDQIARGVGPDDLFVRTGSRLEHWVRRTPGWLEEPTDVPETVVTFAVDAESATLLTFQERQLFVWSLESLSSNQGSLESTTVPLPSSVDATIRQSASVSLTGTVAVLGIGNRLAVWRFGDASATDRETKLFERRDAEIHHVLLSPSGRFLSLIMATGGGRHRAEVFRLADLLESGFSAVPVYRFSSRTPIHATAIDPGEQLWTVVGDHLPPTLYPLPAPSEPVAAPLGPSPSTEPTSPLGTSCPGGRFVTFESTGARLAVVLGGSGVALCDTSTGEKTDAIFNDLTVGEILFGPDDDLVVDIDEGIDQVVRVQIAEARSLWPPVSFSVAAVIAILSLVAGVSLYFLVPHALAEHEVNRLIDKLNALGAKQVTPQGWFIRAAVLGRSSDRVVVHRANELWSAQWIDEASWGIERLGTPKKNQLAVRALAVDRMTGNLTALDAGTRTVRHLRLPDFEQTEFYTVWKKKAPDDRDDILCVAADHRVMLVLRDKSSPTTYSLVSLRQRKLSRLLELDAISPTNLTVDAAGRHLAVSFRRPEAGHRFQVLRSSDGGRTYANRRTIDSNQPIKPLCFEPRGRFVVTTTGTKRTLTVYDLESMTARKKNLHFVTSCVIHEDLLFVGTIAQGLLVLQESDFDTQKTLLPGVSLDVLDISHDGRWLLVKPHRLSAVYRLDLQPLLAKTST